MIVNEPSSAVVAVAVAERHRQAASAGQPRTPVSDGGARDQAHAAR